MIPFGCMSVCALQRGLLTREYSAREVAQESLRCIEARDAQVHAFLEVAEPLALAAADRVDAALASGGFSSLDALAGVPVAFKDNLNLAGTRTTCASLKLRDNESTHTAECVRHCLEAGCIPLGKLNMDEFAFGSSTETSAFGRTANPWSPQCVPGGSSGGSAAAVAAGFVPVSLGSDAGGSIRQPAAFCGVLGVKPSYGMVSSSGVMAFVKGLDQVGVFSRCVEDAALMLNAVTGGGAARRVIDFAANLSEGVRGMRIGFVPAFLEAPGLTTEVRKKVEEAIVRLESLGAQMIEVNLPNAHAALSAYYVLGPYEAFANLAGLGLPPDAEDSLGGVSSYDHAAPFGPEARRRIVLGSYLRASPSSERYDRAARYAQSLIRQDYARAFEQVECILAPVTPRTAFGFGEVNDPTEMYLSDMFTVSVNIAGNAAMSFPVGLGDDTHLPVGVQLIAPAFKDEIMLRVAAALEGVYGTAPVAPAFSGSV